MQTVTDKFLTSIGATGKRKTVVDLYYGDVQIENDLTIVEGSIKLDRSSTCRRSGNLVFSDHNLFPRVLKSTALSPYGVEARIRTGIVYPNKTEELVNLGVFILYGAAGDVNSGLIPSVDIFDRAKRVEETSSWAASDSGFNFGGVSVFDAIRTLVLYSSPGWPGTDWSVNFSSFLNDKIIPGAQYNGDTDRWSLVKKLAESVGGECYFDVDGNFQVVPPPVLFSANSETDAVWTANSQLSANIQITRENTYNSVMVLGAAAETDKQQPFAVVYDSDIRSRTVWNGYFGKKTLRVDDSTLTTFEQCQHAATRILQKRLGFSETITFDHIQNPALDVADIIIVPIDGVNNLLMVESVTLPLNTGTMSVTTRTTQFTE